MKFYYYIIIILCIKIIINLTKYFQCKYYLDSYFLWVKGELKGWSLTEAKQKVKELLQGAGVEDCHLPFVEPVGFNMINTSSFLVLDNFPNSRNDVFQITITFFHDAIGVYRRRIFETFNPLFWLEFFVFLPKKLSSYLGINSEKISVKIFQVLYWLVSIVTGFIYTLYKTNIDILVKDTLTNIIK